MIIPIIKEVKPLIAKGGSLHVNTNESLVGAMEFLSLAKKKLKEITAIRKSETASYEQQIKEIEINYTPTEKVLKTLIESLTASVSDYQTKQTQIRIAKEKAIADRIGAGKGKLSLDKAVEKITALDTPIENVGSSGFREYPTLKITNKSLIPREYLIPDEKAIMESLKEGREIPGCEIAMIVRPVNR